MPTNTQLAQKLMELEERIAAQEVKPKDDAVTVPAGDYKREDNPGADGGWLIETPNQEYSGVVAGILFTLGTGIVDADIPGADLKVEQFVKDYGYKATPLDGEQLNNFHRMLAKRKVANPPKHNTLGEALQANV